jgi:hypothetical protein
MPYEADPNRYVGGHILDGSHGQDRLVIGRDFPQPAITLDKNATLLASRQVGDETFVESSLLDFEGKAPRIREHTVAAMTAAYPAASRLPDRTGVCGAGRSVPSECEIVTRPGFSSPNQPDQ